MTGAAGEGSQDDQVVPSTARAPRPGEPGFDFEAAFYVERDHRRTMLARQRTLTEENEALWRSVIDFTDEGVREALTSALMTANNLRASNGQYRSENNVLREHLRRHGIEFTDTAAKGVREDVAQARKLTGQYKENAKHTRRRVRKALDRLQRMNADWFAQQMSTNPPVHVFGQVMETIGAAVKELQPVLTTTIANPDGDSTDE